MTHSFPTRRSSDLGTVRSFAIVVRDITDQRAAESSLRNSEAHLRSILSTVPDAMIVIDERGTIDRKSTRLNSSLMRISYAVFCLKKKKIRTSIIKQKSTSTTQKKSTNITHN